MAQQDDFIRTALRVPPDLHKSLHASATENNRTFNAEIVARLQQSFNLEPMKETKRSEIMEIVNQALDERMEIEMARITKDQPRLEVVREVQGQKTIDVTVRGKKRTLEVGPDDVKEKPFQKK